MAGSSVIGALRVDLGLNSAEFTNGLAKASGGLNKFGVQLTLGLETIANGIGQVIGAVPRAIKGAIDHADALSKSAQKAGVTTEALSRLAYAADFSDVSLEGMTGGLQKLAKGLADAAENSKGPTATAFRALGIAVTDSSGKLRSTDAVFTDVADRFSRMEDGATKTALAMRLFGKSGAEMIPLLNGGAGELKRMADEADRLGITISSKTGRAAEKFNDTLTLVGKVIEGVVNKLMEAALPALQQFAQMLASPDFATAAQTLATGVIAALSTIAQVVVGLTNAFGDLANGITNAFKTAGQAAQSKSVEALKKELDTWETFRKDPINKPEFEQTLANNHISAIKQRIAQLSTVGGMGQGVTGGAAGLVPPGASSPPGSSLSPTFTDKVAGDAADKAKKAYAKVIASANDRIGQSRVEADALGKTALEADRLRFSQDLLSDATRDGTKLLPAQKIELGNLADKMAEAAEQTRVLTDIYDTGKGVLGSFFSDLKSDLMDGTSLWGSFADAASKALGTIADKALGMAADGIWDILFGALKGSIGGGVTGSAFTGGWGSSAFKLPGFANGGSGIIGGSGGVDSKLFMAKVTPGEAFAFGDDATAGKGHSFSFSIDARGAGPGVAEQLDQWARLKLPSLVRKISNDPYAVG